MAQSVYLDHVSDSRSRLVVGEDNRKWFVVSR